VESDDLDARVVRALNYYRALVLAGKHVPGAAARRALRGAQQAIDELDKPRGDGTWH
jgi:hypothetical protein